MYHELEKERFVEFEELEEEDLEFYIKAGKIAAAALKLGADQIKEGAKPLEILNKVEEFIRGKGAAPAFPAQMSYNHAAAHQCPGIDDKRILKDEIVKIDVGVAVNGFIADNAKTIDLSGKHSDLIKASKEALEAALKVVGVGVEIREIGKAVHEVITSYGFSPIKNLSGHGLSQWKVHTPPSIPNFDNNNNNELEEGMVIAIEPFATNGTGEVYEAGPAEVYMETEKKPIRDMIARTVYKKIENYQELPFAKRWLGKEFGKARTEYALRKLQQAEIIKGYPPLIEAKKGMVTQHEHTVIVLDKPIITTKQS